MRAIYDLKAAIGRSSQTMFDNSDFDKKHPRDNDGRFEESCTQEPDENPASHQGKTDISHLVEVTQSRTQGNKSFTNIGKVSLAYQDKIAKVADVDVGDFEHGIDESTVRHIFKNHGNPEVEAKLGQVAVTKKDFEKLKEVFENPDQIRPVSTGPHGGLAFELNKTIGNRIYCIQEVRKGRKKMALVTMWIKKTKKST